MKTSYRSVLWCVAVATLQFKWATQRSWVAMQASRRRVRKTLRPSTPMNLCAAMTSAWSRCDPLVLAWGGACFEQVSTRHCPASVSPQRRFSTAKVLQPHSCRGRGHPAVNRCSTIAGQEAAVLRGLTGTARTTIGVDAAWGSLGARLSRAPRFSNWLGLRCVRLRAVPSLCPSYCLCLQVSSLS